MKKKNKLKLLNHLKQIIKYSEFNELDDKRCVYISSNYFWYLVVRARNKIKNDNKVFDILNKYKEIEKMKSYLNRWMKDDHYYMMTTSDAKYLINSLKVPEFQNVFLRSSVRVDVFEEWVLDLEKEYKSKVKHLSKI